MTTIEDLLKEKGLILPLFAQSAGSTNIPARVVGSLIFVSGQTPKVDGVIKYKGVVGKDLTVDEGYLAAQTCMLNCLAAAKSVLGSLDRLGRIIKVSGYVRSAPGFSDQPRVINGASDLLVDLLGENGKHARIALGVAELPAGSAVEVDLIAEIL